MNNETVITLDELRDFIYRSKRKGFANTDKKTRLPNGTSVYSNRELPWLYTDTYCGNTIERGTEDVHYDMLLVWSMQYRGGVLEPFWDKTEAISRFLKHALMQLPEEFPVRGPELFRLNEFEYRGETFSGDFVYRNE
ncbi:MAG: DUF5680 domain-containing protein [Candidatus Nanoarchaeia archaeon]